MKNKTNLCVFSVSLLLSFLLSCGKDKEWGDVPNFPPIVLTSYHISANVDSILVDAAYSFQDPDTLNSIYSISENYITIQRYDSVYRAKGWLITGAINLKEINYPKTFWITNNANNKPIVSYQTFDRGGYWPHISDSTFFSITLENFDHDTLSGTFQGFLFQVTHSSDSMIHVTNGTFKVLLNKIS